MNKHYKLPSNNWTDETLDNLGNCFVHFQIGERYGIPFWRYLQMVQDGMWAEIANGRTVTHASPHPVQTAQ